MTARPARSALARWLTVAAATSLVAVSATASTLAAQAAVAAPDTAAARAEVLATVTRLFDGMRKRDTADMRSLFHPAALLMSSGVRNGTPAISSDPIASWLGSIGRARAGSVLDERLMNTVVHVQDGLASVWTEYEFWVDDKFSHCGVDAMVLGRTAEGWKFLSLADTRRQTGCRVAPTR